MGRRAIVLVVVVAVGCGAPPPAPPDLGVPSDLTAPRDLVPRPDLALTGPATLSQTGLYSDFAQRTLSPGVFRYVPRFELWSDGASKERYLLLSLGMKIDTSDINHW